MGPLIFVPFLAVVALLGSLGSMAPAQGQAKKVEVGKNVFLEVDGESRRVLVNSTVCLRKGMLEQLLTRKRTKEHEAILAADVDARDIHKALLLAKAAAGSPVKFRPKFELPRGDVIKITLEYEEKQLRGKDKGEGKNIRVPAQQWVRNVKTQKDL